MKILRIVTVVIATIFGALVCLAGCIWFLQGINVLPGSFMTGQITWAINGSIAILCGASTLAAIHWKR